MKFKSNAKYDIVVPTSMGVRITPVDRQPVHTGSLFQLQVTSAESNVISTGSSLGLKTKVLTAFVKDSPIAQLIKNDLSRRQIAYDNNDKQQDGPWGHRHQFNIADSGFGSRAPRVFNDRAGEVGQTLSIDDFDIDRLLTKESVKLIHISGLIASLSESTSTFCLELARRAKKTGTIISFDINYRASFWRNRETELRKIFDQIASLSDILIGNEEDFQLGLGIDGPSIGGSNVHDKLDAYQRMLKEIKKDYPNANMIATTLREVKHANEHLWGAIVLDGNQLHMVEPRPIQVLDRIGGGDGFVGGFLYGLLTGMTTQNACHFGWANGAFTVTLKEDYSMPLSEEQIWSVWEGNARIRR